MRVTILLMNIAVTSMVDKITTGKGIPLTIGIFILKAFTAPFMDSLIKNHGINPNNKYTMKCIPSICLSPDIKYLNKVIMAI